VGPEVVIALAGGGAFTLLILFGLVVPWRRRVARWKEVARRVGLSVTGGTSIHAEVSGGRLLAEESEAPIATPQRGGTSARTRRTTTVSLWLARSFPAGFAAGRAGVSQKKVVTTAGFELHFAAEVASELDDALDPAAVAALTRFFARVPEARLHSIGDRPDGWLDDVEVPITTEARVEYLHPRAAPDVVRLAGDIEAFVALARDLAPKG
jgi:hypothetical protein